jgi:hypothetical protein
MANFLVEGVGATTPKANPFAGGLIKKATVAQENVVPRKTAVSENNGKGTLLKNDVRITLDTRPNDHNRDSFMVSKAFQRKFIVVGSDNDVDLFTTALEEAASKKEVSPNEYNVKTFGLEGVWVEYNGLNAFVAIQVPTSDKKPLAVEKFNNTLSNSCQWSLAARTLVEQFKVQHPNIDWAKVRRFEANLVGGDMFPMEEGLDLVIYTHDRETDLSIDNVFTSPLKERRTIKGSKGYLMGMFELAVDSVEYITDEFIAEADIRKAAAVARAAAKKAKHEAANENDENGTIVAIQDSVNINDLVDGVANTADSEEDFI